MKSTGTRLMPNTKVGTSKRNNHEQAGHNTAANCPIDGAMKNTRTQPQLGQNALEPLFLRVAFCKIVNGARPVGDACHMGQQH